MNSATSAGPMANSVFMVAPQNGYPMVPGGMSQMPLYPHTQLQGHLIPGNAPGLEPTWVPPAQRALKKGKVFGTIQILIGLIHIGLGSILGALLAGYYRAFSFYIGFPFWGAVSFILSGAFSVSAENHPGSSCLLNASVSLNIISVISSIVGIALFITDMSLNPYFIYPDYYNPYWGTAPGMATSGVLLVFCLLEFCIACTSTHFGCQLVHNPHSNVGMVIPNVYMANPMVIPEPVNPPQMYPREFQASR